ncbi:hypothetical protein STTU_3422 [Streptomyces sp. Tu6071]|nr:hypothetical protein STTU_3422 [Streptomyces sp. Tu6071]
MWFLSGPVRSTRKAARPGPGGAEVPRGRSARPGKPRPSTLRLRRLGGPPLQGGKRLLGRAGSGQLREAVPDHEIQRRPLPRVGPRPGPGELRPEDLQRTVRRALRPDQQPRRLHLLVVRGRRVADLADREAPLLQLVRRLLREPRAGRRVEDVDLDRFRRGQLRHPRGFGRGAGTVLGPGCRRRRTAAGEHVEELERTPAEQTEDSGRGDDHRHEPAAFAGAPHMGVLVPRDAVLAAHAGRCEHAHTRSVVRPASHAYLMIIHLGADHPEQPERRNEPGGTSPAERARRNEPGGTSPAERARRNEPGRKAPAGRPRLETGGPAAGGKRRMSAGARPEPPGRRRVPLSGELARARASPVGGRPESAGRHVQCRRRTPRRRLGTYRSTCPALILPCAVCRVPCAVCRVPCAVCRVPCAVCRVPCAPLFSAAQRKVQPAARREAGACAVSAASRKPPAPTSATLGPPPPCGSQPTALRKPACPPCGSQLARPAEASLPALRKPVARREVQPAACRKAARAISRGSGASYPPDAQQPTEKPHAPRREAPPEHSAVGTPNRGTASDARRETPQSISSTRACSTCRCWSAARTARWSPSSRYRSPRHFTTCAKRSP